MSCCLVTGGAGFIGSHVVDHLIQMGNKVIVLDDLSGGYLENVNKKAIFIEGSICDNILVDDVFKKYKFDYVFHLAAYAAEGLSHFIKRFNYTNNVIGSVNLINASINIGTVKCFIFTSSIAVYGENQTPMLESMEPLPQDPYGIAKYAVELDLKETSEMFNVPYIIFRPHNVFGERQNIADKYRNVLGIFINQAMKNEPFTLFGDGTQTRSFSYIKNIAKTIAESYSFPKAYNEIFNIGDSKPISVMNIGDIIARKMNVKPEYKFLDERKEVKHAFSSHEKVHKYFGSSNEIGIEEGLDRMINWALKKGSQCLTSFEGIEVTKNLPKSWKDIIDRDSKVFI